MTERSPTTRRGDALEVFVKVMPGARRESIGAVADDGHGQRRLVVSVTAKAEGGQANRALVRLLARSWNIAPSSLELTCGQTSRLKRVRLDVPAEKANAVERLLA